MHIKIKNKLYLFAWSKDFKFKKYQLAQRGLYSDRIILRIGFLQVDVFTD
jgi:hypothetical protein